MKPKKYIFKLKQNGKPFIKHEVLLDANGTHSKILDFILEHNGAPVKKDHIAEHFGMLGAHETYERVKQATTLRKVQKILRELRDLNVPLVGSIYGCWVASSTEEVADFTRQLREKIKHDTKSEWSIVKRMESNFCTKQPAFSI